MLLLLMVTGFLDLSCNHLSLRSRCQAPSPGPPGDCPSSGGIFIPVFSDDGNKSYLEFTPVLFPDDKSLESNSSSTLEFQITSPTIWFTMQKVQHLSVLCIPENITVWVLCKKDQKISVWTSFILDSIFNDWVLISWSFSRMISLSPVFDLGAIVRPLRKFEGQVFNHIITHWNKKDDGQSLRRAF